MYIKTGLSVLCLLFFFSFSAVYAIDGGESGMGSKKGVSGGMTDYMTKPDEFWRTNLAPDVYNICRQKGTEAAGSGKYDKFFEKGTYYCACCGGDFPLFKSETKFDAKSGWPSFWDIASKDSVSLHQDKGWFHDKTEVRCARCDSHLGDVFDDGPKEHTGKRYCMNSASLSFVPEGQKPVNNFVKITN